MVEEARCPVSEAMQSCAEKIAKKTKVRPGTRTRVEVWDLTYVRQSFTIVERRLAQKIMQALVINAFESGRLDMVRLTGASGAEKNRDAIFAVGWDGDRPELIRFGLWRNEKMTREKVLREVDGEMALRKTEKQWMRTMEEPKW